MSEMDQNKCDISPQFPPDITPLENLIDITDIYGEPEYHNKPFTTKETAINGIILTGCGIIGAIVNYFSGYSMSVTVGVLWSGVLLIVMYVLLIRRS